MEQVMIRQASENDLDAILLLMNQLGYWASFDQIKTRFYKIIRHFDTQQILVAELNSKVIGAAHVLIKNTLMEESYVEIISLVVDETYRSQGVGREILKSIDNWALSQGLHMVQLYTNVLRQEAHKFYFRNGFSKIKDSLKLKKHIAARP